jgi:hypothetical protein
MKKFLYFIFALSMIIWLGGSLIRNVMIFDLFIPGIELTFKPDYTPEIINYNIHLYASTALYTGVAFGIAFLTIILIALFDRKIFRLEGWLFMSIVLFLLVSPIVIYNLYLDYSFSIAVFWNDFSLLSSGNLSDAIFKRYNNSANTVLSGIAYLANVNIILYAVYKPLRTDDLQIISTNE